MSAVQGDGAGTALGSPGKKSKLSLKFFQKKEPKRALDFSEPQAEEPKKEEQEASEQVVYGPAPGPASPGLPSQCEKRENLLPFVGLNNLGNTCYLNSILQVLYYCPGFREGIKELYNLSRQKEKPKEESDKGEEFQQSDCRSESLPAHVELLGSFYSLMSSVEHLQSSYLLNPEGFTEGELTTPPRKILNSLRQLNPMYEGYLQHDAQEVLQCILGYIQEACDFIRKEQNLERKDEEVEEVKSDKEDLASESTEEETQVTGKRKSDSEVGNAKKKPKSVKLKKSESEEENVSVNKPMTRSKRKSSSEVTADGELNKEEEVKKASEGEESDDKGAKDTDGKRKKRAKLGWLRPSGKQPSIFSKFCSVGKIRSTTAKNKSKEEEKTEEPTERIGQAPAKNSEGNTRKHQEVLGLMEKLFQGRLVLRTRCLECESCTERREGFQDISVPVLDDQPSSPEDLSQVSPDPKSEIKTLSWAIAQFASVERIVGEDKYFCETCHHYTEAERSLAFEKTPEVITIHLKRFSASSLELDPYAGLSKVNTPLQTPLTLSLEEWYTKPSSGNGQSYELFAVVMHSGITISGGHYTTYVRMSDLNNVKVWLQDRRDAGVEDEGDDGEPGTQKDASYDDGEVSFSVRVKERRQSSLAKPKSRSKKLSEGGVGLLGGQRSLSEYELANGGSKHTDKVGSRGHAADGPKRTKSISRSSSTPDGGLPTEPESEGEATAGAPDCSEGAAGPQAGSNLLSYEGKWLLFDDSEVRLLEEEEFLRACSPDTCSSSTPYLLFYKRKT